MRASALLGPCLGVLLALGGAPPPIASAQDEFDDEFEDEFEEEEEETPPSAREEDEEDPFGDDFEEDLEEAEEEVEEAPPGEEDEAAAPADEEAVRARRFRAMNSFAGPVGGLRVVGPDSGADDSFRVALNIEFFFANDFLVDGDNNDHIGGTLSLSWTPFPFLEFYGAIASYANSNDTSDPELFQVLGDTLLGVKGFYNLNDVLTVGGDLGISLLNTVGDIGLVFKSTSLGFRAGLTADLRGLESEVPFVLRFSAQYYMDNSSRLIRGVERRRFENLDDPPPPPDPADESRHLVTRVERFSLNINRTDFFTFGLGLESPLRVMEDFYISPLLEWVWRIPVNRRGYSCLFIPDPDRPGRPLGDEDGCLDKQGAGAFPMTLTLGARIHPPVDGLAFTLAADIGLTGKSTFVRELAPNAPYNIIFGASYAYDTREVPAPEPVVREVTREVEVQLPPPLRGRIHGTIVEQGQLVPVPGAIIRFPGRDLTGLVAGDDGTFMSYPLEPGAVQMELSHPEYEPATCTGTIPEERPEEGELTVEVRCEMVARPRVGRIEGRVRGDDGAPIIGASVQVSGPASRSVVSDGQGRFNVADLPPGNYQVRVEAENFLIKVQAATVVAREAVQPEIVLVSRPRRPLAVLRPNAITIRRQILFVTDSADIDPQSEQLLSEVADVIIRNPDLRLIEIQGHTDDRGGAAHNQELSQRRADSVRDWLVAHGVEATRLEARGFGDTRPLVPNITPGNRARNRRVMFVVKERADAAGGGDGGLPPPPAP